MTILENNIEQAHGRSLSFTGNDLLFDPASTWNKKYPTDEGLSTAMNNTYRLNNHLYDWIMDLPNIPYVRAAMDFLNRDFPGPCGMACKTWSSRRDAYMFLTMVNYIKKFGIQRYYEADQCRAMSDTISAIENELVSVQEQSVAGAMGAGEAGEAVGVLNKLKNYLITKMGTLNCTELLNAEEQSEFLGTVADQIKQSSAADDGSEKVTKYIIWGMLGVVVMITLIVAFKSRK